MTKHKYNAHTEQFKSALTCENRAQAEEWIEREVQHYVQHYGTNITEALEIIKTNLGYMAGYYNDETIKKIHELFGAVHPIFGTATYHTDLSIAEMFEVGVKRAKGDKL